MNLTIIEILKSVAKREISNDFARVLIRNHAELQAGTITAKDKLNAALYQAANDLTPNLALIFLEN